MRLRGLVIWMLSLAGSFPGPGAAAAGPPLETVHAEVAPGLTGVARYYAGPLRRPAVLLLHGFLDSAEQHPVSTLQQGLAETGFAVLAPTLTLGVERRHQRLACQALHLHHLGQDVRELAIWIDWLVARGYRRVVLASFGAGLIQVVDYLGRSPSGKVGAVLAMVPDDPDYPWGTEVMRTHRRLARAAVSRGDDRIGEYRLAACRRYRAPAQAFLSYASWDRKSLLRRLRELSVPLRVIVGETEAGNAWPDSLAAVGVDLQRLRNTSLLRDRRQIDSLVQLVGGMLRSVQ